MNTKDPYADITPADSTMTFTELLKDPEFVKLAVPNVSEGEPCFDFELPTYDFSSGEREETEETFHLSNECAERPVAMIFGSYT